MAFRPWRRLKFEIERLILRSAWHRLLVIAVAIGLISLLAGWTALLFARGISSLGEGTWWAFLRLTDPGYLGDDEGTILRTISTIVTVLGYVLFLGALVAILTQWLNQTITRLQRGLTPLAMNDHILVLGWTSRTPTIVKELMLSEGRMRRFLRLHGARGLRIVILVEDLGPEMVQDLRDLLGPAWSSRQIVFRSGTPLRLEHLQRVDFLHAAAILLPFADFGEKRAFARDERTMKILLSISSSARALKAARVPLMVTEVFDAAKTELARRAYEGPIEILPSDVLISRLVAQNVRHPGISSIFSELLTHEEGNEIYIRDFPDLVGTSIRDVAASFPRAIVLGTVPKRPPGFESILKMDPDRRLRDDERLVLIAPDWNLAAPGPVTPHPPVEPHPPPPLPRTLDRRILVLGWNHKAPAMIAEFARYPEERFHLDFVSLVPAEERALLVRRYGAASDRVGVRHLEADFDSIAELSRLDPGGYDNVVILASDWMESEQESDARTILGFLILSELLATAKRRPQVLVELLDPENVPLLVERTDVLISPLVLSHLLTQVALRRDLSSVFEEIFGPGGAEIFLRPATDFVTAGELVTFGQLQMRTSAAGEIVIGIRAAGGALDVNPPSDTARVFAPGDEIVVLTQT